MAFKLKVSLIDTKKSRQNIKTDKLLQGHRAEMFFMCFAITPNVPAGTALSQVLYT